MTLKELFFDDNFLAKSTYESIAEYIKQNHSLTGLAIRVKSCSTTDTAIIKEALKFNKKIKVKYEYSNEASLLDDVF